jgi:hypothetical protein
MSTYVLLVALWFGVACVATLLVMAAGAMFDGWQDLDFDEPDAHAQIADDVHLAKVALIADAMKADREKALDRMAENARGLGLDYSKDGA